MNETTDTPSGRHTTSGWERAVYVVAAALFGLLGAAVMAHQVVGAIVGAVIGVLFVKVA